MERRAFVRLLAAASAGATVNLDAATAQQTPAATPAPTPTSPDLPKLRIVSSYAPSATPGMPGPFPGRVVAVKSERCVDTSTNTANAEVVREMMSRGMQSLTSSKTDADAWRRFFSPTDVVGIKV